MNLPTNRKSQVSVGLTLREKKVLGKQSFSQNRSISQIIRFAIKKYLDGLQTPADQPINGETSEELIVKLGMQLAKKADIINDLRLTFLELHSEGVGESLNFKFFSDNAAKITGYDKFDLHDENFFYSKVHADDLTESLMNQAHLNLWENHFRFKVASGEYFNTRISFKVISENRIVASWQFLDVSP
jgi:hypothetical protein